MTSLIEQACPTSTSRYQIGRKLRQSKTTIPPNLLQQALGIESDDVVNYCFPKEWPADHERRARYIGEWLKTEARYLAS
jgi:hypothetical protein